MHCGGTGSTPGHPDTSYVDHLRHTKAILGVRALVRAGWRVRASA